MTEPEFESEVSTLFPMLAEDVADNRGLLHLIMGSLCRHAEDCVVETNWEELEKACRLLDRAFSSSPGIFENAIRVSFVEYFDFHGHEARVRKAFGPVLEELYDDQTLYMEDLARRANLI